MPAKVDQGLRGGGGEIFHSTQVVPLNCDIEEDVEGIEPVLQGLVADWKKGDDKER